MTPTAPPPMRAIGILRVSKVKGREGDSFHSPEDQRGRIAAECERQGLDLIATFPEMDVSGGAALERRPGLSRAVEAVQAGQANIVIVAYFDRLFRSLEVQTQVIRLVEDAGGRLLSVDVGKVSNGTAAEWLSATMHGAFAEYVRRQTAEKTGDAQRSAVEQGIPPMILPPGLRRVITESPGGKLVKGEIELDELAPVVAEAVRKRADGAPVREVREFLAQNGIERSHHGVISMLKSRLLVGEIVFGENRKRPEDVWRGTCPAVVDRTTWERAQRVSVPRGPKAKSDRLLARLGVLRCASCGSRMVVGSANHSRYFVYRCPPNGDCPRRVTIAAEVAERVVLDAMRAGLDGTVGVRAAGDNIRSARVALQCAQDDLDAAIRTLADFANEPAAVERLRELRQARDDARERVDRMGVPDDDTIVLLGQDWDSLSADDQRRCIQATIDRVMVRPAERGLTPDERVDVIYHGLLERLRGQTPPLPSDLA